MIRHWKVENLNNQLKSLAEKQWLHC